MIIQPFSEVDSHPGEIKASMLTYLLVKRRSGAPGGRSQTPSLCCLLFSGPSSFLDLGSWTWIRLDWMTRTLILPRCSAAGASAGFATGHGVVGSPFPEASLHWSRSITAVTRDSLHRWFHPQLCGMNQVWNSVKSNSKTVCNWRDVNAECSALHFLLMWCLSFFFSFQSRGPTHAPALLLFAEANFWIVHFCHATNDNSLGWPWRRGTSKHSAHNRAEPGRTGPDRSLQGHRGPATSISICSGSWIPLRKEEPEDSHWHLPELRCCQTLIAPNFSFGSDKKKEKKKHAVQKLLAEITTKSLKSEYVCSYLGTAQTHKRTAA